MEKSKMSKKKIVLKNVRLSFPNLHQSRTDSDGPRFDALFIMDKGSKNEQIVDAAIEECVADKWNGKVKRAGLAKCGHHDGEAKEQYDGFDDTKSYVSASSRTRPSLKDRDGRTPLTEEDGKLYPGAYVVAYLTVSAMDTAGYGKQCNFYIDGVQFYKDGEALGAGKGLSDDEFLSFDDEDDDDDIF
jgi:hypothetical protein